MLDDEDANRIEKVSEDEESGYEGCWGADVRAALCQSAVLRRC
jgi:hypothetical protein